MRNLFWALAMGVIAAYLFFFALGAFAFDDVLPISLVVVALAIMWAIHAWLESRHAHEGRDPDLVHARERRGF